MFEKMLQVIDHILGLPGSKEIKEEALVGLNLLYILGCRPEEIGEIDKVHAYIWDKGVKLPCFAPIAR